MIPFELPILTLMVAKHFLNLARIFGKKDMGMLTISTVEFGEHPNLSTIRSNLQDILGGRWQQHPAPDPIFGW